jgi:LysM repeat protein
MARLPKVYYSLTLLILIIALSGCELRRNPDEISDPAPVSEIPPTLAPLGAAESLGAEATAVPTIISVQPTATTSNLEEGQAAPNPAEPDTATAEAVDLSGSEVENEAIEETTAADIAPVAEEVASVPEEASSQQAIVVDATTTEEQAIGPVAANPPFSETGGSDDTSTYSSSGTYIVQPGDTLFGVAQRFGTTVQALAAANGLANDVIYAGQMLNLAGGDSGNYANQPNDQPAYQPPANANNSGVYHMVASGETLYSIALQYNSSVDAIASANQIDFPFTITVGQQLAIPVGTGFGGPPQVDNFGPPPGDAPAPDNFYQGVPGNASLHMVAPGETLYSIALQYGTSVDAIAGANRVPYPYTIGVGQQLLIPAPGAYAGPPPPMPADGYFQQPYQGYPPQAPADGFNQPPYQGYQPPAPADNYGAAPGNYPVPGDDFANTRGTHTVAPGETLYSIAQNYGLSAETLAAANGLSNPNQLFVGQVLYLP